MVNPTYEYYKDEYFGTLISETDFPRLTKRATQYVSARTFGQADTVEEGSELANKVKDAICCIADLTLSYSSDNGVTTHGAVASETVGPWTRNYVKDSGSTNVESSFDNEVYNRLYVILANTGLLYAGGV